MPADCIYKVISQNGNRTLFERHSTLRPPPQVTLRSWWHSQQQQQQSESASSSVWQWTRGTSVKIEDGEIKNDTTDDQCSTSNWKQMQDTESSVEEKPKLENRSSRRRSTSRCHLERRRTEDHCKAVDAKRGAWKHINSSHISSSNFSETKNTRENNKP